MKKYRSVVVIPARYASSRFPAKPLALLGGRPMIQHTYARAVASSAELVLVATDHLDIVRAVDAFGGRAVMTDPNHPSGTDRIWEAVRELDCEVVVNVQGDEPLIPTEIIDRLIAEMLEHPEFEMATVAVPADRSIVTDPNKVKVVADVNGRALYFSRAAIPFLRDGGVPAGVLHHWGIYAYRYEALRRFVELAPSALENCEKLEQLRALENGMSIRVLTCRLESVGVDTPEDLARAEKMLKEKGWL